jgi:hypothetical protein
MTATNKGNTLTATNNKRNTMTMTATNKGNKRNTMTQANQSLFTQQQDQTLLPLPLPLPLRLTGSKLAAYYEAQPSDDQREMMSALYYWLLHARLVNYGYDRDGWRKLTNDRRRARRLFRRFRGFRGELATRVLAGIGLAGRLSYHPNGKPGQRWKYTAAQSWNEECTALMLSLSEKDKPALCVGFGPDQCPF